MVKVAANDRKTLGESFSEELYDYRSARAILNNLCNPPAEQLRELCKNAMDRGPYIFTYTKSRLVNYNQFLHHFCSLILVTSTLRPTESSFPNTVQLLSKMILATMAGFIRLDSNFSAFYLPQLTGSSRYQAVLLRLFQK